MIIHCGHDELVPICKLKLHPRNPNKHSNEQIERLAKILSYQGWRYPVNVSKLSGYVVSGHGRIEAAKLNGWESVPVKFQDFTDDDQEYAAVVSDNSIASWAELDLSVVNNELQNFDPSFDLDLLGIADFVLEPSDKFHGDEDDVPEVKPDDTRVKSGDLFILGTHRLLCGDSTDINQVNRVMNSEKADMVFTDPPYGLGSKKSFNQDHKDYDDEVAFDLSKLSFETDFVIWGSNYYDYLPQPRTSIGWLVWDKRPSRDHWDRDTRDAADRRFGQHFEIACTSISEVRGKMLRKTWGGFYGTAGDETNKIIHKTQKPIELFEMCAQARHRRILDYFGGSGSTLIACEKTNRKCFMMEIDPHYCAVILDRWAKYTGKDPIREDGTPWSKITHTSV